jgi:hypothetical protein
MTTAQQGYGLEEVSTAFRLMNERIMVPNQLDVLYQVLPRQAQECTEEIKILFDDGTAVCILRCRHGEWRARSDLFNLTEALLRAGHEFEQHAHPALCRKTYRDRNVYEMSATDSPVSLDLQCTQFEGHRGWCGEDG